MNRRRWKRIEAPEKEALRDALAEKGYSSIHSIAEAVAEREGGHYYGKSIQSIRVCLSHSLSGRRTMCTPLKKELLYLCQNNPYIASVLGLAQDSNSGEYISINALFREEIARLNDTYQNTTDNETKLKIARDLEDIVEKYKKI